MKRKLSIAFCMVSALVILIPLALTDFRGGGVSIYEKRQLAARPKVIAEDGIHIRELGKLDDWINDNIGLRDFCQNVYTNLFVKALGISSSDKVYFGKEDWYFYTLDSNMEIGTGKYLLSQEQLSTIAERQQKISDYYAAQNIDYLLVLTPSKVSVYTEYVADGLTTGYTMADQLTEYLEQNTSVRVINTKPSVLAAKDQGQLFWRTDTHWTQLGSYAAYSGIIDYMNMSGVTNTKPIAVDFSMSSTGYGEFNAMLGNYQILGAETIPVASMTEIGQQVTSGSQYDMLADLQLRLEPNYPAVIIENENLDSGELLILGDSQWEMMRNMPLYFSHNFSKVVSLRADTPHVEIDAATTPDVLLFACSERFIDTKLLYDVPAFIADAAPPINVDEENIPGQLSGAPLTLYVDTCNDENQTVQQTVQIMPGTGSYHLYGWAGDVESGQPLSALYVKAGDKIYRCNYGIDRQSVVDYFQNENLRYTGFSVTLPESAFGNGAVEQLQFIGVSQSGTCRYEDYPYAVSYPVAPPAEEPAASPEMPMDEPTQQDSPMALVLMLCVIAIFVIVALFLWKKTSLGTKIEQHSFLFEELVKRDFTLKYKRTVLGAFWSLLSPLINLLIMWLVFNKMLGNNIDHFVIYLFAGQLVFGYFSEATNMGMTSLLDNASIFTKVNVPKYLFLFSRNISSLINFGITLLVFFLFVAMEGIPFTWKFLMLIYPALCLILINLGIGMILSALFVFFRDMQYLWGLALQLIMWMSAIFYSIDGFDQTIRNLFLLNPVYLCIRYFRKIVIENTVPALQFHLLLAAMAAAFFGIGCWMYKRYNTKFLYYV